MTRQEKRKIERELNKVLTRDKKSDFKIMTNLCEIINKDILSSIQSHFIDLNTIKDESEMRRNILYYGKTLPVIVTENNEPSLLLHFGLYDGFGHFDSVAVKLDIDENQCMLKNSLSIVTSDEYTEYTFQSGDYETGLKLMMHEIIDNEAINNEISATCSTMQRQHKIDTVLN